MNTPGYDEAIEVLKHWLQHASGCNARKLLPLLGRWLEHPDELADPDNVRAQVLERVDCEHVAKYTEKAIWELRALPPEGALQAIKDYRRWYAEDAHAKNALSTMGEAVRNAVMSLPREQRWLMRFFAPLVIAADHGGCWDRDWVCDLQNELYNDAETVEAVFAEASNDPHMQVLAKAYRLADEVMD